MRVTDKFNTLIMDTDENTGPCGFDTLFTIDVPHILEKIFFPLNFKTIKTCCEVSNAWRQLLTSESYQVHFYTEILEDEEKLVCASTEGNFEEVGRILSSGVTDINCVGGSGDSTPLCQAAKNSHTEVVQLLIDKGAKPNSTDKYGRTPLYWAARKNCYKVIRILIDNGADVREQMAGPTPLHWVAHYGHIDLLKSLMDKGAEPDKKDCYGHTPLQWAKRSPIKLDRDLVKLLLERGSEAGDTETHQELLTWAADKGYRDVVELLLDKGAKPNKADPDHHRQTPLHMAANKGHCHVVQLLIDRGAEPNKCDMEARTPLYWAVVKGYKDVVKILIEGGADPNEYHESGHQFSCRRGIHEEEKTVIDLAAELGHKELVQLLLVSGARPNKALENMAPTEGGKERSARRDRGKKQMRKAKGHLVWGGRYDYYDYE